MVAYPAPEVRVDGTGIGDRSRTSHTMCFWSVRSPRRGLFRGRIAWLGFKSHFTKTWSYFYVTSRSLSNTSDYPFDVRRIALIGLHLTAFLLMVLFLKGKGRRVENILQRLSGIVPLPARGCLPLFEEKNMQKILVVDDDSDMRRVLTKYLLKFNYLVTEANSGKSAMVILEQEKPDLILCDFKLGDMDGTTLLVKIKASYPHLPVIFITGYGDIKVAVEVMRLGAFDYVTKPLFPEEILLTIRKALGKNEGTEILIPSAPTEKKNTSADVSGKYIFGDSPVFVSLLEQVNRVAPTNYSVIIYGETGSGKEGIAQEIHKRSKRRNGPFVAIDCGALSKELASSELFGHEKGAFTGALFQKTGSFELANGGTIFLDEITNLPYDVQVSLLRVVQERKMRKVGGIRDIDLDVRIIIASNESLWDSARKNTARFREDLFHRFNEFTITVPSLRERKEDIKTFASHFLHITNLELEKSIKGFTPEVETIFQDYIWYGNLRELKNVVKRAALLTDGAYIEARTLPFEISNFSKLQFDDHAPAPEHSAADTAYSSASDSGQPQESLRGAGMDAEYKMILSVLKKVKFNKTKAAKILDIDRKTLYNKLDQYQLLSKK
jgi:two-component system response regulator HydG